MQFFFPFLYLDEDRVAGLWYENYKVHDGRGVDKEPVLSQTKYQPCHHGPSCSSGPPVGFRHYDTTSGYVGLDNTLRYCMGYDSGKKGYFMHKS